MYSVIGLGNPDSKYALTPHNVGFMMCDLLSFYFKFSFEYNSKFIGQVASFVYEGEKIFVLKPFTYMNLSGRSVASLVNFYKIDIDKIVVVHDDIDLEIGTVRIKKNSSSGGHKGVQSVIDYLGNKDFTRIKIGVGREDKKDAAEYVLSAFDDESLSIIRESIEKAKNAFLDIVVRGVAYAMNIYNKKTIQ